MLKGVVAVLALWSATALADIDAEFPSKALGIQWSATLQQVQAAYPGGRVYPPTVKDDGEIVYVVSGDFRVLGLDLSVPLIHFVFTNQDALDRVFWHFKYEDRDDALYGVAQALGQDYSTKDEARERIYLWKSGRTTRAQVRIGMEPKFPWAVLGAQSVVSAKR
ncbi:hypothetical protein GCM10011487_49510 [Steroidobacter agaridevorans]|uniref:Uncharacterized protein n=2 Tax=Steroidobacter agaridevorans TaxID=2695856 RepID=A0A829YJB4_9GAMM|nr:hypothetical protein GCM10011487_49510 [Steroidobacter agaridevorans]